MRRVNASLGAVLLGMLVSGYLPVSRMVPVGQAIASSPAPDPAILDTLLIGGADSVAIVAIGNAEGTRTPDGGKTQAWSGHLDPGNGKWNKGSCSWQVGGADSPESADALCIDRLRRRVPGLLAQVDLKTPLVTLAIADSLVQSPRAAQDFPRHFQEAVARGMGEFDAVVYARIESFRDPATGQFNAPGLDAAGVSVEEDQGRRVRAIASVSDQYLPK